MKCVVCDADVDGNHHCDKKLVDRIEAARKSHEDYREYSTFYGTRLKDGFARWDNK